MEEGEDDLTSEINLDDYNVVPRPQELVQQQAKISSAQKRSSLRRDSSKVKKEYRETLEKIKDIKKKFEPFKSRSSLMRISKSSEKIRDSRELSSKFDSHLLAAKKSLSKHSRRSSPSKPSTEDSSKPRGRSSSPAIKHSSEEQNFLKIMKEPALTDYAKHEVLNAQDSYIRLREAKKEGPKSKVIKGTCPDMCPEKERYSRITKNCLAFFELEKGLDPKSNSREVNHSYMVKEYSRSSADQQEPLPHELRPVPVMKFTMDYLICNIIDNLHNATSIAEWYDFVWNRTRSIRKDITQQQFCDVECVDILEKCARFHIFCAEALSEEDTATFDPKINNENLTKCLQTLKHMYHDLLTKGVQCPNEAEFRAYDILLSLSEGETLRLVKDIRKEVFKSPLVKSAFEAAIALNSNNYVKFFKLMETAPYLSSCIMHRYIHEARVRAVQVIIRAYSLQNNPTVLPLSRLVKDLKFKNSEDAAYFCQWHGLTVDESVVTIQRQTFQKPTDAYPISRVESLVQQKMTTGLGMIINNGPLPENPLIWYKPQNSFDDNGLLIDNILLVSEPSDETDFEIEKEFDVEKEQKIDVEKEQKIDVEKEIESDAEMEEDMEFESPSELQQILPEAKVEIPGDLAGFKVKTFENFINKSQKPKTDTFSFFTDNTVKSSVLKPETQKEKFSFVCAPKTTSMEPSINSTQLLFSSANTFKTPEQSLFSSANTFKTPEQSLFSSANTFKIPETVAPTIQIEAVSTFKSETFKDPQTLAKTFSFKSPALSSENTFVKTSFGTNSLSFFTQASKENNSFGKVHSPKSSFVPSFTSFEKNTATTAPPVEVNHGLFSFPSSLKSMATQQDLSKAYDFDEHGSDEDTTNSAKPEENEFWVPSPIADDFWTPSPIGPEDDEEFLEDLLAGKKPIGQDEGEELSVYEDENAFQKIFQEEKDTGDGENSHMSMENDETLNKLREDKINELILNVEDEVYSTCIKDLSSTICKEAMDEEWTIKRDYEAGVENMRLYLAQRALYKWRLFCERKKQRKAYKNSEPLSPWLPMLMNTEYVTSGATNPFVIYKKHCALSRITDSKLKEIETKRGWEPFEASNFKSLGNQLPLPPAYLHTTGIVQYFKLGLVFASYPDDVVSYFTEWMCQKFNIPSLPDARTKELASYSYVTNGGRAVVSVTAIVLGTENIGDCDEFMKGISAMILCCPSSFPTIANFNIFEEKFDVLLKEANLLSAFPLFTIVLDTNQKCNILNQLSSFLDKRVYPEGCFSTLKMNHLPVQSGYVSNSSEVAKILKWLIVKQEPRPILLCATLQNYLEDSYASAFNTLFWKISLEEFKPLVMFPQHIITFYNKVLDSRAQLLCSELLRSVFDCWPPQELITLNPGFKSIDKYLQLKASELIDSLHLPEFNGEPACIEHVWQYVRDIGELSGNNAMLFIDVQTILQTNTFIDWPTIISKCAIHIICANCNNLLDEMKNYVFYMKEDLDSINFDGFWQSLLLLLKEQQLENKKRKFEESLAMTVQKKRKDLEQEDILYFSIGKTKEKENISSISSLPLASSCHVDDMLSSLKSAIKKQKDEDEKILFKLNESISSAYTEQDHDLNVVHDITSDDLPVITPKKQTSMDSLVSISPKSSDGTFISEGTNTWDKFVGKTTKTTNSSPASLSEKLSELRYNIQKNNMLEDNLKRLLNL